MIPPLENHNPIKNCNRIVLDEIFGPISVFQQREAAPHPTGALRGQVRQVRAMRVHRDGGGGREAHDH